MSNIYIQEPPTNGKVLLKTTAGDIDIELWSKEAPKACRNFIQLCLEAYYDNTIFHRVVPGFIVQGGDPTGTGSGGESIYGAPFKDEFHSRLRFNRRGLVAMANAGSHDNGSQFFFTLGRADELNNKHTIFGKVTGDTVYNMLRLSEVDIDDDERPHNPHKIKSCEVLFNPFDDIIPREIKRLKKEKPEEEVKKLKPKGTKNFSLLSFGEEAEEEEEEVNRVSQSMKGKSKSSHDLLKDDPHLSSVPVVESEKGDAPDLVDDGEDESAEHDEYIDGDEKNLMRERIAKKLKKDTSANVKSAGEGEVEKKSVSRSEELRKEARQLKRELLAAKQKKVENAAKQAEKRSEEEEAPPDGAVAEYRREKQKYEALRKQQSKKGTSREDQTLALLNQFKSKLTQAIAETPENDIPETEVEDDEGWMSHVLQFEDKSRKVKDASMQDSDTFEIYDPRNPVNKRRREESKKLMREKKERR
ncbi:CWC27 spliceosome associated cyclophilin [Homo sapiens]|uniref:Spliceosome-associated protein CWC27 homolog n=4 Tax=Homo sapiens TaxID=9606 RepID=CWC27_HUMAN|nr:spliceosome-associated protein CWC27 homolog isoform 1 [Homo sapiens]Q6UX04.1 RecName: Full=Spliceosome-associated protein CWC27 homolog; AltName: Full=Antigen NY-CO-10; AltName: Full=Probable inactive peptidyl-prolyl cis-trans isomerase CWC27 homolog; Short=PPIase CWC27; AltName: Full=Serologically defined colon cancer antigen 10 [Homo sapiens]5Z56_z Chain z, Peptidyl-prolyl cis-trans isomerase CWC27 homolog [Homo sapiens]5Z58_z Chain z, Peptidyl-prolyl cis-trans isomerase CWC27 homolog [Hom|eukprot:NP_005860.2 spliceosome-associated protein CWC27 homolog isoform 1 [Homo sapiens]